MSVDVLGEVNYVAALVAAAAYFAIGALWYSPVLFSRPWMRAIGVDPDRPQSPNPMLFVITGVAYFVAAVALGAIARAAGGSDVVDGIVLGLVTSIGLVAAIMWVNASYESRPAALLGINAANVVVGFVVMAVIMTVWD